jgi:hypothetical protein
MGLSAKEVSAMIFRRVSSRGAEELASDHTALKVLRLLDGKRDVATVARETGLGFPETVKVLTKLSKLKLAESAGVNPRSKRIVDGKFVEQLTAHFSLAVGPIAHAMIEDTLDELGYDLQSIPESMVENLVHQLANLVQEADRRTEFKASMEPWVTRTR